MLVLHVPLCYDCEYENAGGYVLYPKPFSPIIPEPLHQQSMSAPTFPKRATEALTSATRWCINIITIMMHIVITTRIQ